ncbi:MAG: hypothetical protein Q9177_002102 [Variospora cf. flavescens]
MTSLPTTQQSFPPAQYGYAIIMGFVFGLSISTLIMMAQARTLGGTLSISICANLLNKHIKHALKKVLSPQQISDLLGSARWIAGFPEDVRPVVKRIYAEEYRDQAITLTAFAGVKLLVVGMMWERRLRRMSKKNGSYVCYKTYDRFYLRSSWAMYVSAHQMELPTGLRSLDPEEQIKPDKSVRGSPMRFELISYITRPDGRKFTAWKLLRGIVVGRSETIQQVSLIGRVVPKHDHDHALAWHCGSPMIISTRADSVRCREIREQRTGLAKTSDPLSYYAVSKDASRSFQQSKVKVTCDG